MELRHLRYFVAVGELEHFGSAAKYLGIVQPALTKQIHQLEEELGVKLFERLGRGVHLTAAGRVFLEDARETLAQVEGSAHRAVLASQGRMGTLKVSMVEAATFSDIVPMILAEFTAIASDVEVGLTAVPSLGQWNEFRNRKINVGFLYFLPTQFPELQSELLETERVLLCVPQQHHLARKSKVYLRDLRNEPFISFQHSGGSLYQMAVTEACRKGGVNLNFVQSSPSEVIMLAMVSTGVGLCFAAANRVQQQKLHNVVLCDVEDLRLELQLFVAWRNDDSSPTLPRFLDVVRSVKARLAEVRNGALGRLENPQAKRKTRV